MGTQTTGSLASPVVPESIFSRLAMPLIFLAFGDILDDEKPN
jgi:hypothetical protein